MPQFGHPTIAAFLNRPRNAASASTVFRLMKRLDLLPNRPPNERKKQDPAALADPAEIGLTLRLDFTHWKGVPVCNVLEYQWPSPSTSPGP